MALQEYKNKLEGSLPDLLFLLSECEMLFAKILQIESIFSSDERGKTKLHRAVFNENYQFIKQNLKSIDDVIGQNFNLVKETLNNLIDMHGIGLKIHDINFLDNEKILKDIYGVLNTKSVAESKKKEIKDLFVDVLLQKDKILLLKYYINLVETESLNNVINKLNIEELINSTLIFELIDICAMKLNKIKSFKKLLENFNFSNPLYLDRSELEVLLKIYKKSLESYDLQDVRYKIALEFDNNFIDMNSYDKNVYFLELAIHYLIEQSCMDLIKKELKKSKYNKLIEVNLYSKSGIGYIVVKHNGFDTKDIFAVENSISDFTNLVCAKNVLSYLKSNLEIKTIENEGMEYTIKIG